MINRRKAMLFLSSVAVMLPAVIVAENDEHGNVQKIWRYYTLHTTICSVQINFWD